VPPFFIITASAGNPLHHHSNPKGNGIPETNKKISHELPEKEEFSPKEKSFSPPVDQSINHGGID
jgi:hypothetical protein